ncbi:MAG: MMPL family transporter [Verrucomicrobiota bacterium]|jgi:predicted RND superfamily exporter protein/lauroyl/myristoyl acyltransferase
MKSRWRQAWWLLLILPVGFGLSRLRVDTEVLDLLPPDQPAVQGLKLYQQHFANARELIITVRAADADQAEKCAGLLASRLRQQTNLITGVSWQPPWMEQPAQAAEIVAYLWFNQPPESFGTLTNRLAPDHLKAVLADTREVLATSLSPMDIARRAFDPYDLLSVPALTNFSSLSAEQGQKMFASADGTFRILFVQARPDLTSYRACSIWLKSVQNVVAGVRAGQTDWAGVVVRYTGRPAFVTEIAASMQHDLSGSVAGTAVIIALLFWLTHRRWLPMLWLLTLLALILLATLALGGLVLGTVSVMSMGFAAVLLGLAVDYAVVHYQEALAHPQLSVPEIRRAIAPSILWAAITTISAFLVLNLSGLPGLAQLGTLVAIGVALAALVMVVAYLPPLFPDRCKPGASLARYAWWSFLVPPRATAVAPLNQTIRPVHRATLWLTALMILFAVVVLAFHRPPLDKTANALRPRQGEAETALEEMTSTIGIPQDPLWMIVSGNQEREVYQRLCQAETVLKRSVSNRVINGYLLPSALWPRAEFQESNRVTAGWLGAQGQRLGEAAVQEGFETNALFLTGELIRTWARAGASSGVFWPTNEMSQWLLKQFVARTTDQWLVMGLVYLPTNRVASAALTDLSSQLSEDQVLLSSWELLGDTTLKRVREKLWLVVVPMIVLVLTSLWLAFRRPVEVLLGLAVLLVSGLCLLTTMSLAGWSWNLLNLMSLPLMLGTGVDYSIFMQLALRRHGGDLDQVRRSIGRALLLCGGTAIAGFGSLAWSSNTGMASLGKVCAVGIGANMLIAVYLLPAWWSCLRGGLKVGSREFSRSSDVPSVPSAFYRAWLWRLGLVVVRVLPALVLKRICLLVAEVYYRVHHKRREAVIQNLLPVVHGDRAAAQKAARALFRQFAIKIMDLWCYESGRATDTWFMNEPDWGIFEAAHQRGRGVLLITPHLGNWEIGGPVLVRHKIKLLAVTQAEPGEGLTELRRESRARWGIETLVIGGDGFAFVEIIKWLQDGGTVALLIDRPPAAKAVTVELFGRPFHASIAAAELARASGCALIGVTIVRQPEGYAVKVLPEFQYDRQALGNREARRELTRQILRAFEPEIQQHLDQWFHFIPIWPEEKFPTPMSRNP